MHAVVMDSLEEYLSDAVQPAVRQRIEAHLNQCEMCRGELAALQDVSLLFQAFRESDAPQPAPGFYARVMVRAEEQRPASALAGLLALNLAFGRRLAFACLLTLAVLGSYLVSRETGYSNGPSPEAVMAQQELPAFQSVPGSDAMLVTLTTYEH